MGVYRQHVRNVYANVQFYGAVVKAPHRCMTGGSRIVRSGASQGQSSPLNMTQYKTRSPIHWYTINTKYRTATKSHFYH